MDRASKEGLNLTYLFIIMQAQTDGIASLASSLLPFLLIIAVFYFLILRPQQKRQKERAKLLEGVKKGAFDEWGHDAPLHKKRYGGNSDRCAGSR